MILEPYSPSIIVPKKSRNNPSAVSATIKAAIAGASGVDVVAPVIHDGRIVAETFGVPWWMAKRRRDIMPGDVFYRPYYEAAGVTTYDGIIAAISSGQEFDTNWTKAATTTPVAGNYYDLWPVGGLPAAGAYTGSALTSVQFLDTTTGALYLMGNVSTAQKYVASVSGNASAGTPTLWLYDRVLTYEACPFNNNASANFTTTLTAQRYISAGQQGLRVMCTAQTVLGATADTITTLKYTGQKGGAGSSAPVAFANSIIISAAAPTTTLGARVVYPSVSAATVPAAPFVPLASGESGVQKLESWITANNTQTGTLCFVLMYPLAQIPIQAASITTMIDQVMQIASMQRVFDGACVAVMSYFPAATAATINGDINTFWA